LLAALREQDWAEEAFSLVEHVNARVKRECDFTEGIYYSSSELCIAVSANRMIEEFKRHINDPIDVKPKKEGLLRSILLWCIVEFVDTYKDNQA